MLRMYLDHPPPQSGSTHDLSQLTFDHVRYYTVYDRENLQALQCLLASFNRTITCCQHCDAIVLSKYWCFLIFRKQLGVSKNRGTRKSSIFNRVFHYFHHPFWGAHPYFWKHPTLKTFRKFRKLRSVSTWSLELSRTSALEVT